MSLYCFESDRWREKSNMSIMRRCLLLLAIVFPPAQAVVASSVQAFGIFSPVLGMREDVPAVTLTRAYTTDNENVIMRHGEIHRAYLRSDQFLQYTDKYSTGTVTVSADPTVEGSGVDWVTAGLAQGDLFRIVGDSKVYTIDSLTDLDTLELSESYAGTAGSGKIYEIYDDAVTHVAVTDGNPIIKYHYYEKADGTDFLLGFTKAHAYYWNTATDAWDLKYSCSSDCESWSVVTFNNTMYATNNVDEVLTWSGTGDLTVLDDPNGMEVSTGVYLTTARFLTAFEGYLLAANVTVGGVAYPQTIYWSDTVDGSEWKAGNSGSMVLPGPDPLVAAGQIEDFLLIFSGHAIDQVWAVDSSLIFNSRRLRARLGTYSPDSIINGENGELYFLDVQKNIRVIPSTMSEFRVVSDGIDKTLKLIPDSLISSVRSCYVSEYQQKWWAVPYGPAATGNNKTLCVDRYNAWSRLDLAVSAFGEWEEDKAQYTWNNIDDVFDNWHEAKWKWSSVEALQDYRLDICGDFSGYTYNSHNAAQDDSSDFTGYGVIATDLSSAKGTPALDIYKRLVAISVYFRREGGGTASVDLKRDMESTWQSVGSVDLTGSTEILWTRLDCDYRARHFQLKVSGSNPFRFLGAVFYYVPQGFN